MQLFKITLKGHNGFCLGVSPKIQYVIADSQDAAIRRAEQRVATLYPEKTQENLIERCELLADTDGTLSQTPLLS